MPLSHREPSQEAAEKKHNDNGRNAWKKTTYTAHCVILAANGAGRRLTQILKGLARPPHPS
jgi:hypothetical protein